MRRIIEITRLFRKAFGSYVPQIILILVLAVISSISEGIGISAIVPAFSFVSGGGGAAPDVATALIQKFFSLFDIPYTFRGLLIFIGGLFVVRTVMLFLVQVITMRIASGYERDLRKRLFTSTVKANWSHLSEQKIGNLSQLIMSNAQYAAQFFTYFSIVAVLATKTIAYVFVAFNVSALIALFAVFSGALAFVLFQPILSRSRGYSREGESLARKISHFINQNVIGMKTIKAMGTETAVQKQGDVFFDRIRYLTFSVFTLRALLQMLVAFGGLLFVGVVFAVMYKTGTFQIATFGVIVFAINQIFTQVQLGQAQLHNIGSVLPYMRSLFEHEARSSAHEERMSGTLKTMPKNIFEGDIVFSGVSFAYPERGAVLQDVTFSIPQGSMAGIIGASGSGKTTLADLLLRLYVPQKGSITVGGTSIHEIPLGTWRKEVGYVTQDAFLLNDTIMSNIVFYDDSITPAKAIEAAKRANIHDFIEVLPAGYETVVGDRGVLLSGGQRQRIALARVLARHPAILILDEATSSLDSESERAIQSTIESLRGSVTTLVIAHRLSTVANADLLIALDKGAVVEMGAPETLRSDPNSYFSKMAQG